MASKTRPDRHTITTRPVGSKPGLGYGLVDVTITTQDGREFTGRAWGERRAYLAALAARSTQETRDDGTRA